MIEKSTPLLLGESHTLLSWATNTTMHVTFCEDVEVKIINSQTFGSLLKRNTHNMSYINSFSKWEFLKDIDYRCFKVEFKVSLGVPNWWSVYHKLNSLARSFKFLFSLLNFSPSKQSLLHFNTSLYQAPNVKWEQLQFHCPALSSTLTTFVLLM